MKNVYFSYKLKFFCFGFILVSSYSYADGLKVFGPEFCHAYDAGSCINFHYEKIRDAKNFYGQYKYPKGRKAYDECVKSNPPTDGGLAYCAMVFHREEQSLAKQKEMCSSSVRQKYWSVGTPYAMSLYDLVWNCKNN